jgi:hypothetical protein
MYRGDFYIPQNIIGYTGTLIANPTVYFYQGSTQEFGRITQVYPNDPGNVGRSKVRAAADYRIYNNNTAKPPHAEEYYNGGVQHPSRGLFREVRPTDWQHAYLVSAIDKFKNLKSKY